MYAASLSRTQFEELAAWQLILPSTAAFSHLTAAQLRGWWLPATIAHPVVAAMLNADPRPRRPGLLVCRHTQPFPMNLVSGLRVTTAAETILAAARDLGLLDLVILGDSALRMGHCTLTDLAITARQRRRVHHCYDRSSRCSMREASRLGSRSCECCTRQPRFR